MKYNVLILSGVDTADNQSALKCVKENYPRFKSVLFIPAEGEEPESKEEFLQLKKDFKKIGYKNFFFSPLETTPAEEVKKNIKNADVIFLGGGNTFYFMNQFQKKRLKTHLKEHLKKGKLLIGLSAGGILMSPSLLMACFPTKDADECENEPSSGMRGLGFMPFEVCPHYKTTKSMEHDLCVYTSLHPYPVYGVRDGDFVLLSPKGTVFGGKISMFYRGAKVF